MPGAIAIGALATKPVTAVAEALTMHVTMTRACLSMPASLRMAGFTKMM